MYDDRSKDKLTESISQESDFRATAQNKNRNVQCTIAISRGDVLRKQDLDIPQDPRDFFATLQI